VLLGLLEQQAADLVTRLPRTDAIAMRVPISGHVRLPASRPMVFAVTPADPGVAGAAAQASGHRASISAASGLCDAPGTPAGPSTPRTADAAAAAAAAAPFGEPMQSPSASTNNPAAASRAPPNSRPPRRTDRTQRSVTPTRSSLTPQAATAKPTSFPSDLSDPVALAADLASSHPLSVRPDAAVSTDVSVPPPASFGRRATLPVTSTLAQMRQSQSFAPEKPLRPVSRTDKVFEHAQLLFAGGASVSSPSSVAAASADPRVRKPGRRPVAKQALAPPPPSAVVARPLSRSELLANIKSSFAES
jgi:hypothetical protein